MLLQITSTFWSYFKGKKKKKKITQNSLFMLQTNLEGQQESNRCNTIYRQQ